VKTTGHEPAELRSARLQDAPAIEAFLDEYLPELARHREVSKGATDAASCPHLHRYWAEPDRFPFTLWSGGQPVGFALVRRLRSGESAVSQVAEFFVEAGSRRRGIGGAAARALWQLFPGRWELQVHRRNAAAVRFWSRCIEAEATAPPRVEEVEAEDGWRLRYEFTVMRGG
jgi:predicted acetyltransferase